MKKHLGFMYIASRPCGRVAGTCWDEEGFERETAKWIRGMLREGTGNTVKRVERFDGDPMPEPICGACTGKVCQEDPSQGSECQHGQLLDSERTHPLSGLFFHGTHIRVPKAGPGADSPEFPGSWRVASLYTDVLHDAREFAATGRAMAAAGEMLAALQAVANKLGSRPYGTGSYLPKPLRDQVLAAIAKATGQEGGAQ